MLIRSTTQNHHDRVSDDTVGDSKSWKDIHYVRDPNIYTLPSQLLRYIMLFLLALSIILSILHIDVELVSGIRKRMSKCIPSSRSSTWKMTIQ